MNEAKSIKAFLKYHFRHYNAASLVDAAEGYQQFISKGGQMLLAMAGAMSTAELGLSLAEMIRQNKVHAISCTGANLEEDIYNLVAHNHYVRIPKWRDLTPEDENKLLARHLNRVTDTCIPEKEAIRRIENIILNAWQRADESDERYFPHEFLYQILLSGQLEQHYEIDPKDSWLLAAAQKNLPIFVPGWEDSTTGNIYASHCLKGNIKNVHTVRTGIEYMMTLANWLLPNWWWNCRRLPDLCRPNATSGYGAKACSTLGLLLPNQRFDHKLRLLLRRNSKRENYLGKALSRYAKILN